jgi:thiol-disulfide isomerase/thioredoxin
MKNYLLLIALAMITVVSCNNTNAAAEEEMGGSKETIAPNAAKAEVLLPVLMMIDVKGNAFNLADFKGKKVFVNLWASWCPPCRAEIPSIEKLYSKVDKSKAAFIMLSLDNDFEKAVKFAAKNKMVTPVYYPAENLPALFNVQGIPATFIFDEKGNLITRIEGGDDYDTEKYLNLFNK